MADEQKKYLSEDDMGFGAASKAPGPKYLSESDMGFANGDEGGFAASAKQSVGSLIKGAGQAAADFIPGVGQDNAVKQYGQSVIDANPTAVKSLGDIADKPGMAVREAAGNATGSIGGMVGARVLGNAITAAAPLTGPLAPATAAVGQGVAWLGPWAAAALPSFGGIREQQIKDDPTRQDSVGSKALAAAGAGTVGLIENKFGPQEWALKALTKEGRAKLAEKFAANSVAGSIGKGVARGAAVEGAEELAQNPVEQLAAYQDPTTAENVQDTLFGGAMGFLGGGVFGGGVGAASRVMGGENGKAAPPADPADTQDAPTLALPAPTYTGTPNDQVLQAEAERANAVAEAEARAAGIYQQRADFEAAQQGQPEQRQASPGLELVRQAYAAQLDALQQQEQGQPPVLQSAPPDGRAALEAQAAQAQAQREADRAVMGPDDEILQSTGADQPPHRAMGIDPDAGPLSAGAAIAVDTGVAGQMQAAAQAVTAQDAAPQQAAGPLAGSPLDAGARFVAGEKWSKPGRSGYVIDRVSDDGKMAIARDGNDTFTISLDAETANGWKPEGRDLGAAQQDPAAAWNSMSTPERAAVAGRVGLPPVIANNIPRTGWEGLNSDLQARISKAMAPAAPVTAPSIEGADLGNGWAKFSAESGTAGVPRAEMPQIKAEHRGAMVNFMNARGVQHQEETVPAASLKPTQAEFSREKVARAKAFDGGSRSILVSADNHVLDGHHQWMAARDKGEDVKVIRLDAPIRELVGLAHDFPSSTTAGGAATAEGGQDGQSPEQQADAGMASQSRAQGHADVGRGAGDLVQPADGAAGTGVGAAAASAERSGAPAEPAGAAGGGRDAVGQAAPFRPKNLVQLVREAGGVSIDRKADINQDSRTVGVFRKGGMDLDGLAELLQQNGFMTDADVTDTTSGAERAAELLRAALAGERVLSMNDVDEAMGRDAEAQYRDEIRRKASEYGIRTTFRPFGDVERDVLARDGELAPEDMGAYDYNEASIEEQDAFDAIDALIDSAPQLSPMEALQALGFTEDEIRAEIENAGSQGRTGKADAGAAQERATNDRQGAQDEAAGSALESYTEQDLAARDEAQRLADESRAKAERDADQKAQADAERGSFSLTGSDRPADVLAAQGHGGMFDAPAAANQEPIKNETRTNAGPAPAERDSDQEPIKNPAPAVGNAPSPLEALFSDLNSDSTRKANKAKKAAAKLPEAARIEYVQANFHDILIQMMEAGALEVNGFATLTEDNAPCL